MNTRETKLIDELARLSVAHAKAADALADREVYEELNPIEGLNKSVQMDLYYESEALRLRLFRVLSLVRRLR